MEDEDLKTDFEKAIPHSIRELLEDRRIRHFITQSASEVGCTDDNV